MNEKKNISTWIIIYIYIADSTYKRVPSAKDILGFKLLNILINLRNTNKLHDINIHNKKMRLTIFSPKPKNKQNLQLQLNHP